MKKVLVLNRLKTSSQFDVNFTPVAMVVENPTGSPIYIREGSPEIPSATNYDHVVAAATQVVVPVTANIFGLNLASASLLASGGAAISGLSERAIITVLDENETIPTFGSASFLSLSLSDLSGGLQPYSSPDPGVTTLTPAGGYDLGPWGGLVVEIVPDATGAQGRLVWYGSNNGTTWVRMGLWPVWPNSPFTINLPRVARYVRLDIEGATVGGSLLTGTFSARGSLIEVLNAAFTSTGGEAAIPFSIGAGGTFTQWIFTAGLEFMTLSLEFTSYNPLNTFTYEFDVGESTAGPWRRLISDRAQLGAGTDALSRGMASLSSYARVIVTNTGGATIGGNLKFRGNTTDPSASTLAAMAAAQGGLFWQNESIFNYLARQTFNTDSNGVEQTPCQANTTGVAYVNSGALIPQPGIILGPPTKYRRWMGLTASSNVVGQCAIGIGTAAVVTDILFNGYIPANDTKILMIGEPGRSFVSSVNRNVWVFGPAGGLALIQIFTKAFHIGE